MKKLNLEESLFSNSTKGVFPLSIAMQNYSPQT